MCQPKAKKIRRYSQAAFVLSVLVLLPGTGCDPATAQPLVEKTAEIAFQAVVTKLVNDSLDAVNHRGSDEGEVDFSVFFRPPTKEEMEAFEKRPKALSPEGEARQERIRQRLLEAVQDGASSDAEDGMVN